MTPVFCWVVNSGVLAPGHPTPFTPVKLCKVMIIAVARVFWVLASVTFGSVLNVIFVPRTFPAATLSLSFLMKSARAGGQFFGIGTLFAPTPEPALMLKFGTREGLIAAARVSMSRSIAVGRADAPRARKKMAVVKNCILKVVLVGEYKMIIFKNWV